jgi:hypothetical protein
MNMFSAFVFIYLLCASMFYAYVLKRSKHMAEPTSERTHPQRPAEILELYPQAEERKAA